MSEAIREAYTEYQRNKERACILADVSGTPAEPEQPRIHHTVSIRSKAGRILAKQGKSVFGINDLYRPLTYIQNRIEKVHDDLLLDHTTGLIWQGSGSPYPVSWDQAMEYVQQINEKQTGGQDRWRMPTVNELLSLLNPPPPGEDFCFQSPFSSVQKWIWSGDTRSSRASWLVNLEMGFVLSGDVMDFFYVRAVCSL
jgi:serine/threonine-protein kinase